MRARKRSHFIAFLLIAAMLLSTAAFAAAGDQWYERAHPSGARLTLNETGVVLSPLSEYTLTASLQPPSERGDYSITVGEPQWSSDNRLVALVRGSGLSATVTGMVPGSATVTVTVPLTYRQTPDSPGSVYELTASCEVAVMLAEETAPPALPPLSLTPAAATMNVGGDSVVYASLGAGWEYYPDGDYRGWYHSSSESPIDYSDFSYSFSNPGVAGVTAAIPSANGVAYQLKGLSAGTTTLTVSAVVRYWSQEQERTTVLRDYCTVTVLPDKRVIPGMTMPSALGSEVGETMQITNRLENGWGYNSGELMWYVADTDYEVWFEDKDVQILSDNPNILSVDDADLFSDHFLITTTALSEGVADVIVRVTVYDGERAVGALTRTCTVTVARGGYTVTARAGSGGSVTPEGKSAVSSGGSLTLTASASEGYVLERLTVNGVSVEPEGGVGGARSVLTLTNINEDKNVYASFKKAASESVVVTASAGTGGGITPEGASTVARGGTLVISAAAEPNYRVAYALINGERREPDEAGADSLTLTLSGLDADTEVKAFFEEKTRPPYWNPFSNLDVNDFKNPYEDVTGDEWYYSSLALMSLAGLLDGVDFELSANSVTAASDGSGSRRFNSGNRESRGESVQMLYNAKSELGINASSEKGNAFSDVQTGSSYFQAILWAAHKSVVNGYGGGLFGPFDGITREQMCAIIQRTASLMGFTLPKSKPASSFTDSASVSAWASDAVSACQRAGVISGYSDGSFRPAGSITRAEAVTMLYNFMRLLP